MSRGRGRGSGLVGGLVRGGSNLHVGWGLCLAGQFGPQLFDLGHQLLGAEVVAQGGELAEHQFQLEALVQRIPYISVQDQQLLDGVLQLRCGKRVPDFSGEPVGVVAQQ